MNDDPSNLVTGTALVNGVPCVCIPQHQFDLMALCFYGGGPDYPTLRGLRSPNRSPNQSSLVVGNEEDEDPVEGQIPPATNPLFVPNVTGRITPIGKALTEALKAGSKMSPRPAPTPEDDS